MKYFAILLTSLFFVIISWSSVYAQEGGPVADELSGDHAGTVGPKGQTENCPTGVCGTKADSKGLNATRICQGTQDPVLFKCVRAEFPSSSPVPTHSTEGKQ